jgi:hypothetical protein
VAEQVGIVLACTGASSEHRTYWIRPENFFLYMALPIESCSRLSDTLTGLGVSHEDLQQMVDLGAQYWAG